MSQPEWKLIANLGDRNPIEHGGYFVYEDETGVYPPEAELLIPPDDNGTRKWEVRRFILEPCTFVRGVLSDSKYHPDHPAWFAKDIQSVADFVGQEPEELIEALTSGSIQDRAFAWKSIGDYHGLDNLDDEPIYLTRKEVEKRY